MAMAATHITGTQWASSASFTDTTQARTNAVCPASDEKASVETRSLPTNANRIPNGTMADAAAYTRAARLSGHVCGRSQSISATAQKSTMK